MTRLTDDIAFYRQLVEKSAVAVFAIDPRGTILTWNWGCELFFGRSRSEAAGHRLNELVTLNGGVSKWDNYLKEALATGSGVRDFSLRAKKSSMEHGRFVIRTATDDEGTRILVVSVQDRTEITQLEQQLYHQIWALTESERRLRNLVPDAVVVIDRHGIVTTTNDHTGKMFDYADGEIRGRQVDRLVPGLFEEARAFERQALTRARGASASVPGLELTGVRKGGDRFPVEVSLGAGPENSARTFVAAIRDATDRMEAQKQLAEVERLKELDQFKVRFINTAAHELKTPLTAMNLQLHLLQTEHKNAIDPKQRRRFEVLERSLKRFNRLVEDLLDAARLEATRLGLKTEPTRINAILYRAVENFRPVAHEAGLNLVYDPGPEGIVDADPGRLHQVMMNLLNNAVKFTPRKGRIRVSTRQEADMVVVAVTDTGMGLTEAQIERLFQPFSQVHKPSENAPKGTGLGLYLSSRFVELHGGTMWCESEGPGKGSTFLFRIPLVGPAEGGDHGQPNEPSRKKPREPSKR